MLFPAKKKKISMKIFKISNDLLLASDQGCILLLVLLSDLTFAAFDTIDHNILITLSKLYRYSRACFKMV